MGTVRRRRSRTGAGTGRRGTLQGTEGQVAAQPPVRRRRGWLRGGGATGRPYRKPRAHRLRCRPAGAPNTARAAFYGPARALQAIDRFGMAFECVYRPIN